MIKDKEQYVMVKERRSEDVVVLTFTKKKRRCDTCLTLKGGRDITIINYPIIHKTMGRLIMTKRVCTDCYSEVKEILDSLKYN